jgi:Ca-activated chloride channel family protein
MQRKTLHAILITVVPFGTIFLISGGILFWLLLTNRNLTTTPHTPSSNWNTPHIQNQARPDFSYTPKYETQSNKNVSLGAKLGNEIISTQNDKNYLLLHVTGNEISQTNDTKKPPLNLSIVIDKSGSMGGQKMNNVKNALISITPLLSSEDKISIVTYDDKVYTIYDSTSFDKEEYINEIQKIKAGGSTYLEGGLRRGLSNIAESSSKKSLNKIILLSDGLANVGVSNSTELSAIVEQKTQGNITVSTIGVGADYDEKLMSSIAIAGNGSYYFLEDHTEADRIFTKELEKTSSVVAKDVTIDIQTAQEIPIKQCIGCQLENSNSLKPHNITADNTKSLKPHNITADNTNTYLLEIDISRLAPSNNQNIANINLTYTSTQQNNQETLQITLIADVIDSSNDPLQDDEVYYEYINGYIGDELWIVYEELDEQENQKARERIDNLISMVKKANKRLDGAFDKELTSLTEKKEYLVNLKDNYINESSSGRIFQKSNQNDSYKKIYNK